MPVLDIQLPEECKCGGSPTRPTCKPGSVYGSIIPGWMLTRNPGVLDPLTQRCYDAVKAMEEKLKPENVIFEGLDPLFAATEKEWHDPSKRVALLKRMATQGIHRFKPPGMTDVAFIRLWAVRLKGYLDMLSKLALYDVIPRNQVEQLNMFFQKF